MACFRCGEDFDGVSYAVVYDKCRGKTCPDCGKVRNIKWIRTFHASSFFHHSCIKCKREISCRIDKLCGGCFLERERKRGCICFFDSGYNESEGYHTNTNYYCPLCDDGHPCREALCKKCFEKLTGDYQRKLENIIKEAGLNPNDANTLNKLKEQIGKGSSQILFKAVLSTAIISLIVGFFLGWLFFKKLRKKRKMK